MQTSRKCWQTLVPVFLFLLLQLPQAVRAQSTDQITEKSRCEVCGMFVAKYPNWITRIEKEGKPTLFFDGVKDLMVYYFNPEKYGGEKVSTDAKILVKDYYTLEWIDGRKAYFVGGSDVYGPMGNELIPFSSEEEAKSFQTDHKGKDVFRFDQITEQHVEAMRHGQRMR